MDLFQYDFMQPALIGALVIGLAAPALGIYLVQRRLALIGDGIGHVALTGVGAGLLLNRSPVLVAVIVATRRRGRHRAGPRARAHLRRPGPGPALLRRHRRRRGAGRALRRAAARTSTRTCSGR